MKTTELRLGNFIQDQFGDVIIVDGLDDMDVFSIKHGDIPIYGVDPIPLTEQWLLDFGFKVKRDFYEKGKLSISSANLKDYYPNGRVYYNSWAIVESQPKYVHQLQNLYFALAQEELILKERTL